MSSSPLESGFNTRDWPVKIGHPEVIWSKIAKH